MLYFMMSAARMNRRRKMIISLIAQYFPKSTCRLMHTSLNMNITFEPALIKCNLLPPLFFMGIFCKLVWHNLNWVLVIFGLLLNRLECGTKLSTFEDGQRAREPGGSYKHLPARDKAGGGVQLCKLKIHPFVALLYMRARHSTPQPFRPSRNYAKMAVG